MFCGIVYAGDVLRTVSQKNILFRNHSGVSPMNKRTFIKLFAATVASSPVMRLLAWAGQERLRNWAGNVEYSTDRVETSTSLEQVQGILAICNKYRVPVWPVSTGRNFGYGLLAAVSPVMIRRSPTAAPSLMRAAKRAARAATMAAPWGGAKPGFPCIAARNWSSERSLP